MPRVIGCAACRQTLTLPDGVQAGQQVKCPACSALMVVPGAAPTTTKPVPIPRRSGSADSTLQSKPVRTDAMAKPLVTPTPARPGRVGSAPPVSKPEVVEDDVPVVKKGKKKKKKEKELSNSQLKWILGGSIAFALLLITCLVLFVPWGRMFSPSVPEAELVDVYTAVNSMGYNNVGLRVMNSDTAALCIPGPRQIMITRPNKTGKYVLLRLKVPYEDVTRAYAGSRTQIVLTKGAVQLEYNGVTKDAVFVQEGNAEFGHFQLSYQPPMQEGLQVSLRDYLGPKKDLGGDSPRTWAHEGSTKEYAQQISFENSNGMQVMISSGAERQDGGGGNILEHATGKKILGNYQAFTGPVAGYVYVDWNMGCGGFIVSGELEQPNEIGLNWAMKCIVELPPGATSEVNLKILGKSRKVKLK